VRRFKFVMIFTKNVLHQNDKSDLSGKMDEKHKKCILFAKFK